MSQAESGTETLLFCKNCMQATKTLPKRNCRNRKLEPSECTSRPNARTEQPTRGHPDILVFAFWAETPCSTGILGRNSRKVLILSARFCKVLKLSPLRRCLFTPEVHFSLRPSMYLNLEEAFESIVATFRRSYRATSVWMTPHPQSAPDCKDICFKRHIF